MFLFSLLLFSELFVVFIGKYYGHENNYNIALTTELEVTFYLTIFVLKWFDFFKQVKNLKSIKIFFKILFSQTLLLKKIDYSGRHWMGSWIMGTIVNTKKFILIGKSQITLSYLIYFAANSLIIISWFLESVCLNPKEIPLSGFHCKLYVFLIVFDQMLPHAAALLSCKPLGAPARTEIFRSRFQRPLLHGRRWWPLTKLSPV